MQVRLGYTVNHIFYGVAIENTGAILMQEVSPCNSINNSCNSLDINIVINFAGCSSMSVPCKPLCHPR